MTYIIKRTPRSTVPHPHLLQPSHVERELRAHVHQCLVLVYLLIDELAQELGELALAVLYYHICTPDDHLLARVVSAYPVTGRTRLENRS